MPLYINREDTKLVELLKDPRIVPLANMMNERSGLKELRWDHVAGDTRFGTLCSSPAEAISLRQRLEHSICGNDTDKSNVFFARQTVQGPMVFVSLIGLANLKGTHRTILPMLEAYLNAQQQPSNTVFDVTQFPPIHTREDAANVLSALVGHQCELINIGKRIYGSEGDVEGIGTRPLTQSSAASLQKLLKAVNIESSIINSTSNHPFARVFVRQSDLQQAITTSVRANEIHNVSYDPSTGLYAHVGTQIGLAATVARSTRSVDPTPEAPTHRRRIEGSTTASRRGIMGFLCACLGSHTDAEVPTALPPAEAAPPAITSTAPHGVIAPVARFTSSAPMPVGQAFAGRAGHGLSTPPQSHLPSDCGSPTARGGAVFRR